MQDVLTLSIEGMHCEGCVRRVTAALQGVKGVEVFPLRWARRGRPSTQTRRVPRRSLPLSMASAFPHMLGSEEIAMTQTLKIEGSEAAAAAESNVLPERITIPVTGMTCSACQSFVQRTLASQAGVKDAAVNLMLHNATVTFDPGVTSASALVDTIRGTGYGAEIPAQHSSILAEQAEHDEEQLREYRQLRLKAAVSVTAGFLAMMLSMPLMSLSRVGGMER